MATNIPQWAQNLPAAVQAKIPEGATGCTKDGDVYIFTKDGAAMSGGKFNADGSVWSASATSSNTPTVSQQQISQQIMQQGGSVFGSGFTGTGGDLSTAWMGGNYNINTNKLMGTAGLLGATSMIASEVPFGLGGLLGSLAMPGIMAGFMKSMSFNFNFGNMFTSKTDGTQSEKTEVPEGFEKTNLPNVYKKDGKCYTQDKNKNWLECDDTGNVKDESKLPEGYEKTVTKGLYRKGDDYVKYDAEARAYVACDKDGNKIEKKADDSATKADGDATKTDGDAATATTTSDGAEKTTTGGRTHAKTSGKTKAGDSSKTSAGTGKSSSSSAASGKKSSGSSAQKAADPRPNFMNYEQFTSNKGNLSIGVKSDTKNPDGSRTVIMENGQRVEFDSKGRLTRRIDGTILKYEGDDTRPSSSTKSKSTSYTHTTTYGAAFTNTTTDTETTTYKKTNTTKISYSAQKQDWDKKGIKYSYKQDAKTGNYILQGPTTTVVYDKNGKFVSETRKNKDGSTLSLSYKNGYEVRTTKTRKFS